MTIGPRSFVDVPGSETYELPPLLLSAIHTANMGKILDTAQEIINQGDMILAAPQGVIMPPEDHDRRQMDLALNLVDRYLSLRSQWGWGDSILQWIRQCETTFESRKQLKPLLRFDVWPHAGRASFVTLLEDKAIEHPGVNLENAVGLRLSFRQLPPLRCCSDQFLIYLNASVGSSAYHTWSEMTAEPASLPPERFDFQVLNMSVGA